MPFGFALKLNTLIELVAANDELMHKAKKTTKKENLAILVKFLHKKKQNGNLKRSWKLQLLTSSGELKSECLMEIGGS